MKDTLECEEHGIRKIAFVCQHLVNGQEQGFWEPFDSDANKEYKSEELNAWCNKCDQVLMKSGEWNDKTEDFADIQIVCDKCFFQIKKVNKLVSGNNG